MNILNTIIAHKREEVRKRQREVTTAELEKTSFFSRKTLSLERSLQSAERSGIIAEFKRRSPSRGEINAAASVVDITRAYTQNGASALSVLTDHAYFGGSDDDLAKARVNEIPILRKDFIIDEFQLVEARSIGADIVLLIASCLTPEEVRRLTIFARSLDLEVLLEVHDESELGHICDETTLIGVNNRNLKSFEVNIERSLEMAEKIPVSKIKIAESGINSIADVALFRQNGFKGFLIGELFMRQADPAIAFAEFVNALPKNSE